MGPNKMGKISEILWKMTKNNCDISIWEEFMLFLDCVLSTHIKYKGFFPLIANFAAFVNRIMVIIWPILLGKYISVTIKYNPTKITID